jgi:hypothetical protein
MAKYLYSNLLLILNEIKVFANRDQSLILDNYAQTTVKWLESLF